MVDQHDGFTGADSVQVVTELLDDETRAFPGRAQFPALPLDGCGIQEVHKVPDFIGVRAHLEIVIPLEPLLGRPELGPRCLVSQ